MQTLKCECGNTEKWKNIRIKNNKTKAVCKICRVTVKVEGPVNIANVIISNGITLRIGAEND